MHSTPVTAGSACGCRLSPTGRSRSRASHWSARKRRAATSSTRRAPMRPASRKANATCDPHWGGVMLAPAAPALDLDALYRESNVGELLEALDRELVGLAPVKRRVREIAALLLVEKLRRSIGLQAEPPPLHMSFTGNPRTGKTTVAMRMAWILHALGYVRKGQLVAVTRDDLVGQYIGHTAPKTKEVLKRAMGGVLFIDEAYYLYRPENERDYGQEAIEILLQVMESQRDDLVVIFAGYKDRMDRFFSSNPGMMSRVAHPIVFPDYSEDELMAIADLMLRPMQYDLSY